VAFPGSLLLANDKPRRKGECAAERTDTGFQAAVGFYSFVRSLNRANPRCDLRRTMFDILQTDGLSH
jgi:hypothetical protein